MKSKLKGEILELLEKDKEFRYAVARYLGYDTIIKLLEEYSKRFEEHDKKFDIIVQELKELRKTTNELTLILSEVSVINKGTYKIYKRLKIGCRFLRKKNGFGFREIDIKHL
jgi:tRNA A22 N-methylase